MKIIESILQQMPGISHPQKKFLITLFSTILLAYGKVNFTNLSRYSCLSEKTYRRHFLKSFNFPQFTQYFRLFSSQYAKVIAGARKERRLSWTYGYKFI